MISFNNDTLHKVAMLVNVSNPEVGRPLMQRLLTAQLVEKAYNHLSGADRIEALRQETIMNIASYIKENPQATPIQIQTKVAHEIGQFKIKLKRI